MKQYLADRIIKVDETNWRAVTAGFLTWAKPEVNPSNVK
jgi:hypothetical protein